MRKTLIATILMALALPLAACGDSNEGVNENTAKANCKTMVEQELTNPSDSEFQNAYDVQAWEIEDGYRIHGEVAVANSLGGKTQHVYECKVTLAEGEENPITVIEMLDPR